MIDAENFNYLHLTIYSLFGLIALLLSLQVDVKGYSPLTIKFCNFLSILLIVTLTILVGLRGYKVGTDTGNYYLKWKSLNSFEYNSDFLLYLVMYSIKQLSLSYQFFLFFISFSFFSAIYFSFKKVSKQQNVNLYFLLFSFFSFFFCLSLSINVIRQGVSLAFLLLAYSFFINSERKWNIIVLLLFLSSACHMTSIIPLLLFTSILLLHKIDIKYYYILYLLGITLAYLGYGLNNIAPFLSDLLAGDKRASYLSGGEIDYYVVGFKSQFAIFNTVFLIIFSIIHKKYANEEYKNLLKYYIVSSSLFFMAFQLPFSDRWGLFSWIVIPFLFSPIYKMSDNIKVFNTLSILFIISIFIFFNVYK